MIKSSSVYIIALIKYQFEIEYSVPTVSLDYPFYLPKC
jgi:hypothetical protein